MSLYNLQMESLSSSTVAGLGGFSPQLFRLPECVAALAYVWTRLWDKNEVGGQAGLYVYLHTHTIWFEPNPVYTKPLFCFTSGLTCAPQ